MRERQQFADKLYVKNAKVEIPLSAAELRRFATAGCGPTKIPAFRAGGQRHGAGRQLGTVPVHRVANDRALDLLLAPAPGKNGWRTLQKADGINIGGYDYLAPEFGLRQDRVRVLYDPEGDVKGKSTCSATKAASSPSPNARN